MSQAVSRPFLLALEKGVLLCDGAMGTLLHDRSVPLSACLEAVNLKSPGLVAAIHRDYIEALRAVVAGRAARLGGAGGG
jgi:methionine synthase I (cobalamin-dependent)